MGIRVMSGTLFFSLSARSLESLMAETYYYQVFEVYRCNRIYCRAMVGFMAALPLNS